MSQPMALRDQWDGQLLWSLGGNHEGHGLGKRSELSADLAESNKRTGARILQILRELPGLRDSQAADRNAYPGAQ